MIGHVIATSSSGSLCGLRSICCQVSLTAPLLSGLRTLDNVRRSHRDSAAYGGADRLEICGNLGVGGGTTPSLGLVRAIQKAVPHLPLMVCKLSAVDLSYVI
jgi:CutC family